ncbi:GTP-binding protein [Anoxybacter fermentans]|uniref:GTP-binding protein n=1 Tax=Anoxybacter fermentans TaxID=1323375 RepID=A0A3Q9HPN6_9FIRM|nr:GTPase [Anoxybacter fermentans]AZR72792.1 GTP-binding protein [Anoxybacter fermentans]
MSRCLVIGMPNVGKTCFTLNFAEYLGLKQIRMTIKQPAGYMATYTYEIDEAREELISPEPNRTRSLYSVNLELPLRKSKGSLTLIDSCGLADGIHPDYEVRRAMAQTIRKIRESEIVLHLIDLSKIIENEEMKIPLIDQMIMNYISSYQAYAILANKIDLKGTERGIKFLKKELEKVLIIPISALYQMGFREVKSFVWRNL